MLKAMSLGLGVLWMLGLMILSLWVWQHAGAMVAEFRRPDIGVWAARSGAIAVGAAAQMVLLTFVVSHLCGRQVLADILRLLAALLVVVGIASGAALLFAGR